MNIFKNSFLEITALFHKTDLFSDRSKHQLITHSCLPKKLSLKGIILKSDL